MARRLKNLVSKSRDLKFTKCPVCNRGPMARSKEKNSLGLMADVYKCMSCDATFQPQGRDLYKLVDCEPHVLTNSPPHGCSCASRVFRECYLGKTFTSEEWERIAEGGQPDVLIQFRKTEECLRKGELTPHTASSAPFPLDDEESLYFVSSPIYLHEALLTSRGAEKAHTLYLTNRRLVVTSDGGIDLEIALEEIMSVREHLPGFIIDRMDSPIPTTIYPPLYDPAFAALVAIIERFGKQRAV